MTTCVRSSILTFAFLGIEDKKRIHQAISACSTTDGKYEVAEVVNMLISDENQQRKTALPTTVPTAKVISSGKHVHAIYAPIYPTFI